MGYAVACYAIVLAALGGYGLHLARQLRQLQGSLGDSSQNPVDKATPREV